MEAVENGDVILMHTSTQDVETNTPVGLDLLAERGIRAVTLSELYFATVKETIGAGSCDTASYHSQSCPE